MRRSPIGAVFQAKARIQVRVPTRDQRQDVVVGFNADALATTLNDFRLGRNAQGNTSEAADISCLGLYIARAGYLGAKAPVACQRGYGCQAKYADKYQRLEGLQKRFE